MKKSLLYLGILSATALAPLACGVHEPDVDAVRYFCAQAGWTFNDDGAFSGNGFEFESVWTGTIHPDGVGSFEGPNTLLVDDDDLTDDVPAYEAAVALGRKLLDENPEAVDIYANASSSVSVERSEEELAAEAFILDVVGQLSELCPRFTDDFAPTFGESLWPEDYPYFSACKDKFNASGDGVIDVFSLDRPGGAPQDAELLKCPTLDGRNNSQALNFWGPLTTQESDVDGLPPNVVDGFTYSGITVSVHEAPWKGTDDKSMWEGVALWARLARADEAVDIPDEPGEILPLSGGPIPEGARPQDGVGQLGISIQTMDTASVYDGKGNPTEIYRAPVCGESGPPTDNENTSTPPCFETQEELDAFEGPVVPGSDGSLKYALQDRYGKPVSPQLPYCLDYVPNDAEPGEEAAYRDQCWDGFRSMQEITPEWKFYFFPFSEMRQAGWGRVAETFRLDHIKSVSLLTSAYQPVNVMVDEVAFYRRKNSPLAQSAGGEGGD